MSDPHPPKTSLQEAIRHGFKHFLIGFPVYALLEHCSRANHPLN